MKHLVKSLLSDATSFLREAMSSSQTGSPSSTRLVVSLCTVGVVFTLCLILTVTWAANGFNSVPEFPVNTGSTLVATIATLLGTKVWQSYSENKNKS